MTQPLFDPEFTRKLERLSVIAKKILRGEYSGHYLTARRGGGSEFNDHRNYAPGDDLRYLDWNAYGRLDSLFIKRFKTEENINISVFLDASASMRFGENDKFDYARRLAACIAYIGVSHFDRVEIFPFREKVETSFQAFSRKGSIAMLEYLDSLNAMGASDYKNSLRGPFHPGRGKRALFLISDFYDVDNLREGLKSLRAMKFQVCGIHLTDNLELHPALRGRVKLKDSESGDSLQLDADENLLHRYENILGKWFKETEAAFRGMEMPYVRLNTATPFEDVALNTLRAAGILGGS